MDDGTTSYTYGLGRISQTSTSTEYFLGDALGSVRQLTNSAGEVTFAKSYDPYGAVTQTSGEGQSAFGYTGEQQSNDMVYLRARYYNSANGRFQSRDTFAGYLNLSQSQNRYSYAHNNPIRYTDPTGHSIPAPFFIALLRSGMQNILAYIADCDNQNYVIGALGQYVDDNTIGLYSNYFLDLDAYNQDGRNLGHSIALTQAMIETTIGTLAVAAALPTITITLVGGAACVAGTGGLCALPLVPVIAGEVGLLALGTALTAHGGVMIAMAATDGGGGGGGGGRLVAESTMSEDEILDAANEFLGPNYKDMGNGRFVSANGLRQFRIGESDLLGIHGGGPHANFEILAPNPAKPGKLIVIENIHIYIRR